MNDNEISIKFSTIGYQKPIDITVKGINNIESVKISPVADTNVYASGLKVFNDKSVDYISNSEDNCVYTFLEDIEVLIKAGEIVNYARKKDYTYEEYNEDNNDLYRKDAQGNVIIYHKVLIEKIGSNYDRYEKDENGVVILYYKLKANGKFEKADGVTDNNRYESSSENGEVIEYVKIVRSFKYEEYREENKYTYEVVSESDITSVGHVLITKLKLDSDPTMYYRVVKYVTDVITYKDYETDDSGKKIEYAFNKYRKLYGVYKQENESLYKRDDKNQVIKYYKVIKIDNTYVSGKGFSEQDGWVLERDEYNQLIKYAKIANKNNVYEKYDPDKKDKYTKQGGKGIGIPFKLFITYKGDNGEALSKSVYLSVTIPYKTMGSSLELPLYYRPFYFNSVLLLTPQTLTSTYDYNIRDLHKVKKRNDNGLEPEKCYGRLFYSIANGCSIREDLGSLNLYRLNDITLSYINGTNGGSMVIEKPFRCFSEMEGTKKGRATTISDTDKLTREMMYGITEPFISRKIEEGSDEETVMEKRFTTQAINESYNTKKLYIGYGFGRTESRSTSWKHVLIKGGDNTYQEVEYAIYWSSKYGCVYKNGEWIPKTRYKNTVTIDKIEKNGKTTRVVTIADGYRRTNTTWDPITDDDGVIWTVQYNLNSTATGESSITVNGTYTRSYKLNRKIERCGVPCVSNSSKENALNISYYNLNGNENGNVCDRGIREIYCDIASFTLKDENKREKDVSFNGNTGSIIPIYELPEKNSEEEKKIKPIIFDTSKWLDVSFSVTEGHPEDDDDADTVFLGLNDVKFYDDIYWGKIKYTDGNENEQEGYEGIHVKGYSSSNIRYFALGKVDDGDGTYRLNEDDEIYTILYSLYGIGVLPGGYNRYDGVNVNDNIINIGTHTPGTKNAGWKSIHTYLKGISGDVWLCGNYTSSNHGCIDITDVLTDLRKNPYQTITSKYRCGSVPLDRNYIIGVCDNYTYLDTDSYQKEKNSAYSNIKQHTSRFAIIRIYKVADFKNDDINTL